MLLCRRSRFEKDFPNYTIQMVNPCINKMRKDNLFYKKKRKRKPYMASQINNNNNAYKLH